MKRLKMLRWSSNLNKSCYLGIISNKQNHSILLSYLVLFVDVC